MLELLTDIIITILILVSITFIANVKDNKKNTKREDDEITDDEITDLAKCNDINWVQLSAILSKNPIVLKLLKKRFEYEKSLSYVEYCNLNQQYNIIFWCALSMNPEAIELLEKRCEYENSLSKEEYNKLKSRICWTEISRLPNANELLKKRFVYEKCLSDNIYKGLDADDKIDWYELSRNRGAIELIRERIEYEKSIGTDYIYYNTRNGKLNKLNWEAISGNDNAIELIRERFKYQNSLTRAKYSELSQQGGIINFSKLSNKNIMILMKDMKDYYLSNK
jgi:hypothetical protein